MFALALVFLHLLVALLFQLESNLPNQLAEEAVHSLSKAQVAYFQREMEGIALQGVVRVPFLDRLRVLQLAQAGVASFFPAQEFASKCCQKLILMER